MSAATPAETLTATSAVVDEAANTAFADFPRLASFMGRDGYLPRQFASRRRPATTWAISSRSARTTW